MDQVRPAADIPVQPLIGTMTFGHALGIRRERFGFLGLNPGRFRLIEDTGVPTTIKLTLSLIVALVGLGAYLLETKLGDPTIGIIAGLLTAFMILAMWIFPETSNKKAP